MKYAAALPEQGSGSVSDVQVESLKRKREKDEGKHIYTASDLSDNCKNRVSRQ
jgi:Uri superfamily endonuclease